MEPWMMAAREQNVAGAGNGTPGVKIETAKPQREDTIAQHVRSILELIGEDPQRDGLQDTPMRVEKAYAEMLSGYGQDPEEHLKRVFDDDIDGLVTLPKIDFVSMCEHHMLPFFGTIQIAYIPNGKIVGVSKLVRCAEVFTKRLQVQERLATQIADAIVKHLKPLGCAVKIEARHMCMMARGVRQHRASMGFQVLRGAFLTNPSAKAEVLQAFGGQQ